MRKVFFELKSKIFENKYNCDIDNNDLTLKSPLAPHFESSFKLKKFENMAEMLAFQRSWFELFLLFETYWTPEKYAKLKSEYFKLKKLKNYENLNI